MKALDRKLLRELWQIRAQALAIVLVVASGIGGFVAMASTYASLEQERVAYYAKSRFADVFAPLVRAPRSVADRIAGLPGVEAAHARIVARVNVDVPGFDEPVRGTVISLPDEGRPPLNDLHMRRGRWISPERSDEVLVHEAFALAHALEPGDKLRAVMNGRLQELHVAGIVLSPEFVYQVTPGSLFPDDERNGVLWASERALEQAFDMDGAFNDLVLRLARGASEAGVIAAVDRVLAPWGGTGAYPRADQGSHATLHQELEGLRTQAVAVPAIFLGVAAFLLQLVLGRIVAGQREAIAVLKALGYGTFAVSLHYLKLVALVCLAGAFAGGLLGIGLGKLTLLAYVPYFRLPELGFHLQPGVLVAGALIAVVSGFAATLGSVRRVVRLPPAVAMKPPAPAVYRATVLERIGLGSHLPPAARMVVRRLERHPLKSVLSALGVALALGILIASEGMLGSIDRIVDVVFRQEQRQDVTVAFVEPRAERALLELSRLPGVLEAEPIRTVAARLRVAHRHENVALQGIPADTALRRIVGAHGGVVALPPDGLVLSRELARKLGVDAGGVVQVEVLEGERPTMPVRVTALVDDLVGLNAWMSLDALYALLGEGGRISGAQLRVDPLREQAFLDALEERPAVAGAQLRAASVRVFEETMAATQGITTGILALFASVIAVGVIYNTARIILADSARELASLRVLGFTRREISWIFLGELAVIVAAAMPLGWALGWGLAWLIGASLPAELYRLPIAIPPAAVLRAVGIILAASAASALLVRRRLDRLDLIGVLKTRE